MIWSRYSLCLVGLLLIAGLGVVWCVGPYLYHPPFGIEICPPWQDQVKWHYTWMEWHYSDTGEAKALAHRDALVQLGDAAIPELLETAALASPVYFRRRAAGILQKIGPNGEAALRTMLANPPVDERVTPEDIRGRLHRALFSVFHDEQAFFDWLDYAQARGSFALEDEYQWEANLPSWHNDYGPPNSVKSGASWVINPEYVAWCREHRAELSWFWDR